MTEGRRRWTLHASAIGIYILLSLVLTLPLAGQFTTHVPGDGGDDPALAWNLWWVKWALVDQVSNPFDCRHMFHPLGINLSFYTLTVLNGLLSLPLQGVFGLITVSNLLLLSSFILGAYGTFLLVLDMSGAHRQPHLSRPALLAGAFFAGLVYAFSSSKLFYASLGQFNIASTQWIPFYALMLLRMGRYPHRWRYPLLAGLFLLLQGWAEMTYATFLLVLTAIYLFAALWQGWRTRGPGAGALVPVAAPGRWSRHVLWPLTRSLAILAIVVLAGLSPLLAQMLPDMQADGDFLVVGSGFAEDFSADLLGFFVPTQLNPWFGDLVDTLAFPHDKAQHYYIGYAVLALAIIGVVAWRRRGDVRFWALSAAGFFLLALGPSLRVNGQTVDIPLPFRIFQVLPFFKGNRYSSRYGVLLVLSLAVLAGMGLAYLWGRAARRHPWYAPALGSVCALVFLLGHLSVPLPLSDLSLPPAYAAVRTAEADGLHAVLELPPAWRNGFRITGVFDTIFMYAQFYQTTHHQRLLAGNTSRNPELKFQYFAEAPVLGRIIEIVVADGRNVPVDRSGWGADRAIAGDVLRFFDIQQVIVHLPTAGPHLTDYVETVLPVTRIYADEEYQVYDVIVEGQTGAQPGAGALATAYDRLALGEGWGIPTGEGVWSVAERARLMARADAEDQVLELQLRSPGPQRLAVEFNHCRLGEYDLGAEWRTLSLYVPADCVDTIMNDIWLRSAASAPATALASSGEALAIGNTGVRSPADIAIQSAGWDAGDLGHIYVDGVDQSPAGRGYNLVALDPETGQVLDRAAFDTHADIQASDRLVAFIEALPAGVIVALAVKDEVSMSLDEAAVGALRLAGFAGNLRGHFRASHAGVGVMGAPPGSAAEALSDWGPATVVIGSGATRERVYVQLRSFSLTSQP